MTMFGLGNHFALTLVLVVGFFTLSPRTAQAQFIVSPQVAPTIAVVPVRQGLFGRRTGFIPVVAQPVVAPVTVMRPMVVSNSFSVAQPMAEQPITVGRPVVGFPTPVTVAPPVIANSWTVTGPLVTGPVVVARPLIVNQPSFAPVISPVPVQTVWMPAW